MQRGDDKAGGWRLAAHARCRADAALATPAIERAVGKVAPLGRLGKQIGPPRGLMANRTLASHPLGGIAQDEHRLATKLCLNAHRPIASSS
jgi:hypothetical protein